MGYTYKGYIEANPTIPHLPRYKEDVLFLVVLDYKYGERIPVQIGAQAIDYFFATMTEKELKWAWHTWNQVHLNTEISKRDTMKGLNIWDNDHEGVKGKINTIGEGITLPFMTTIVKGIANLMMHSKSMNVVVKSVTGYSDHGITARSYGVLKLGRGTIDVCLRNYSAKQITLPKWTAVGDITAKMSFWLCMHQGQQGMSQGMVKSLLKKER